MNSPELIYPETLVPGDFIAVPGTNIRLRLAVSKASTEFEGYWYLEDRFGTKMDIPMGRDKKIWAVKGTD